MTAVVRVYSAVVYEKAGQLLPGAGVGSLTEPVAEFSTDGTDHIGPRHIVIPAGEYKTVWSYGIPTHFDLAVVRIIEEGMEAHIHLKLDRPTDRAAGDFAATGSVKRWRHKMLRGQTPAYLTADDGLIDSDATADNGDDSGEPAILESPTVELGHIYEVGVSNPGETDLTIEFSSYH
jgi:hypothetical protein